MWQLNFYILIMRSLVTIGAISWLFYRYRESVMKMVRFLAISFVLWDVAVIFAAIRLFIDGRGFSREMNLWIMYPMKILFPFFILIMFRLKTVSIYMQSENNTQERLMN